MVLRSGTSDILNTDKIWPTPRINFQKTTKVHIQTVYESRISCKHNHYLNRKKEKLHTSPTHSVGVGSWTRDTSPVWRRGWILKVSTLEAHQSYSGYLHQRPVKLCAAFRDPVLATKPKPLSAPGVGRCEATAVRGENTQVVRMHSFPLLTRFQWCNQSSGADGSLGLFRNWSTYIYIFWCMRQWSCTSKDGQTTVK